MSVVAGPIQLFSFPAVVAGLKLLCQPLGPISGQLSHCGGLSMA